MRRWIALLALAGCDQFFNIREVKPRDGDVEIDGASSSDGSTHDTQIDGPGDGPRLIDAPVDPAIDAMASCSALPTWSGTGTVSGYYQNYGLHKQHVAWQTSAGIFVDSMHFLPDSPPTLYREPALSLDAAQLFYRVEVSGSRWELYMSSIVGGTTSAVKIFSEYEPFTVSTPTNTTPRRMLIYHEYNAYFSELVEGVSGGLWTEETRFLGNQTWLYDGQLTPNGLGLLFAGHTPTNDDGIYYATRAQVGVDFGTPTLLLRIEGATSPYLNANCSKLYVTKDLDRTLEF